MKKKATPYIWLACLLCAWVGKPFFAQAQSFNTNNDTLNLAQQKVITANNAFAFRFLKEYHKIAEDENYSFSPVSLSACFAMAYAGAEGNTAKQFQTVFGFGENKLAFHQDFSAMLKNLKRHKVLPYELSISNTAYLHKGYPLHKSYQDILTTHYQANFQQVDFENKATQDTINAWGKKNSKGMLPKIYAQYTPQTRFLLANLIFYETKWMEEFSKDKTRKAPFYTTSGETQVPFMEKECDIFLQEAPDWTLVGLPIQGTNNEGTSVIIFMPSDANSLDTWIAKPPQELQDAIQNRLFISCFDDIPTTKALFFLPTFEIDSKIDAKTTLEKLGVEDAFSRNKANFSGITPSPSGLFVAVLEHSCHIITNEKGIKASAATVVAFSERSIPKGKIVKINKPFLFFLRDDNTKAILFAGKVGLPVVPKE